MGKQIPGPRWTPVRGAPNLCNEHRPFRESLVQSLGQT